MSSKRSLASPYFTKKDKLYSIKCIICNKVKNGGIRDKYRLSEDISTKEFLKAVNYIDDDVKKRLADVVLHEKNPYNKKSYYIFIKRFCCFERSPLIFAMMTSSKDFFSL